MRASIAAHDVTCDDIRDTPYLCQHPDGRLSIGVDVGDLTLWFRDLREMSDFAIALVELVDEVEPRIAELRDATIKSAARVVPTGGMDLKV